MTFWRQVHKLLVSLYEEKQGRNEYESGRFVLNRGDSSFTRSLRSLDRFKAIDLKIGAFDRKTEMFDLQTRAFGLQTGRGGG